MSKQRSVLSHDAVPINVQVEEGDNLLFINWSDDHTTQYPIDWLRWQCPCALCRGEMGMPGRLDFVTELKPEETRLDDMQPIGRYAIMPFWGDGHHDGIYTYEYLRDNCHCEQCNKARGHEPLGVRGLPHAR